ncbi:MAG: RidA family protein [Gammaproteobacteria bacterium]|jgi:enamine deaminase RidA (YjgF/YER057c/UK114 family)|nr:RidA family protein [Gammaproteobacteria bacterium]MBP6051080.1 RidA family protein [Pseudomonadales bacterium]MBK6584184.1 RidA family protein [Gammaproteobacteria bacterium]MBK7168565.1 RidA family protein [Gammaproteobacteria bacterium]MBK7520368.1 RidA family protein [Gammaproteobacteria bacterium]
MPAIEHINPPGLLQLDAFSQVVVVSGGRTAYIAGQGAFDQNMKLIGPNDLHAQTVQAFRNLRTALAALGVGPERVVSSTMYVVDLDDAKAGILVAAMNVALDGAAFPPNASTLVGVTRLGMSGMLVEVSAVALLD